MSSPYYHLIHGKYIIEGKSPDGDSVRFKPDSLNSFDDVYRNYLLRTSKDGSLQLRFEGIDAPELHYGKHAQPLGDESRDKLLKYMGFKELDFNDKKVNESSPSEIEGYILTKSLDIYGRPIAYVVTSNNKCLNYLEEEWTYVDEEILKETMNYKMLETGFAYYLSYTSQPKMHREIMRDIANNAQNAALGVWQIDKTQEFTLESINSVTENGQLIYPKIFRRIIDYFKSIDNGFEGNLADWLEWVPGSESRNENDKVIVKNIELKLSDLIKQRNNKIHFQASPQDIVFVEK